MQTECDGTGRGWNWFEELAPGLVLYARQICGSAAEDAVQEVFVRLATLPREPTNVRAWLLAAVRNAAPDALRGERRRVARDRAIAQSAIVYSADNKDMLPESLDVMVKNGQISPKQLVNPGDPKGRRCIYRVIVPVVTTDASIPLAWEDLDADQTALNVAYQDAHVEWVSRKVLEEGINYAEELRAKYDAEQAKKKLP